MYKGSEREKVVGKHCCRTRGKTDYTTGNHCLLYHKYIRERRVFLATIFATERDTFLPNAGFVGRLETISVLEFCYTILFRDRQGFLP